MNRTVEDTSLPDSPDPDGSVGGRAGRRARWWIGGLVALILVAGAGVLIGSRVQSPDQAAANAAPPAASWITAPVEFRVLSQTVITRGDVRPQVATRVGVPSSVEGTPVLTGTSVAAGDEVVEGARLVEVSGRPVFVMAGDVPVYRSLRPGMSGADVAQLQQALGRLGFTPDTDGVFGPATKAAVAAFYADAGYEPVPASTTEAADLVAAQQVLSDADAAVTAAQAAVDAAAAGQPASVVAQAESARNQAQRTFNDAQAAQVNDVALATQARDIAVAERDRVAANPEATPGELDQARLAASQAQAQLDQIIRRTQDAVDAAKEALWTAALALNEATAGGDTTSAQAQLDTAVEARARAQAAVDAREAASGATVAQGEIVFVPTLPARVQQAATTLGALDSDATDGTGSTSDSLVKLAAGDLVVTMSLRPDQIGLVRVGMDAELLDEQTNTTYPAAISEIADTAVTGVDGQTGHPIVLTTVEALPDTLSGANLRVTITAASTETATLVVPLAAVSSTANGSTEVSILPARAAADAEPVAVAVTTGLSADGFVAVEPADADALSVDDVVVVGR
jgi:peptidoglycan hydrolase-like protein with peptidoglycan-binding domain